MRHCRSVMGAIRALQTMDDDELYVYAKELKAPIELVRQVCCPPISPPISEMLRWCNSPLKNSSLTFKELVHAPLP